jgi:MYXO-CTERM domain-containing protein
MMLNRIATFFAVVGALTAFLWGVAPNEAEACGGCFAPNDSVTVVTSHRMAVSISTTQTTLWDQIEYAGDPEDFVWVLPIQGEVLVELADNAFFEALSGVTTVNLQGTFPPLRTRCPDPCAGSFRGSPSSAADAGTAADSSTSVTVYGEAVVGPYETVTIGSEDPTALITWLQDNGYAVPDETLPMIAHYVEEGLNFSVLRLSPNAGVNQMQPVRVTTPGMMPVFPLRMVGAGVQDSVGLDLYIIAEGRYGAANFDVLEVDRSRLAYDWDTSSFNYLDVFSDTLAEAGGRAWITEYAQPEGQWSYYVQSYQSYGDDGEISYAMDDFVLATEGIPAPYLTRLRTDLAPEFLDEDLILSASTEGDVSNYISVDRELNRPAEPSCSDVCTDPGGILGIPTGGTRTSGSRSGCSVSTGGDGTSLFFAGLFAIGGFLLFSRRRKRR